MKSRITLYLLCVLALQGFGQSRKRNFRQREIGVFAGGAYYLGDINPRVHFLYTRPAAGLYFRYTTNYRYAFRIGATYADVFGDDKLSGEANQIERNLNFTSKIYDFHALAEFNFVEYRIGQDKYRFTFFIFAGLGGFYFKPMATGGTGNLALQARRSEGRAYANYQINVPFGVGVKFNIAESWGMGFEWTPRKLYTDYLDDVSGSYPALTPENNSLSGNNVPGTMRGNPGNNDWYFFYGLTLTYKLPGPDRQCYRSN